MRDISSFNLRSSGCCEQEKTSEQINHKILPKVINEPIDKKHGYSLNIKVQKYSHVHKIWNANLNHKHAYMCMYC
jgi:hypothetical protein